MIDIPAELYYKEMALHTAVSLISNAISRSEIKCFEGGKPKKNEDYYLLNISPNRNETSALFWHKVINKVIRNGEALVVEAAGALYCADSYSLEAERPVLGNIYSGVTSGNMTFEKTFTREDYYLFRLDDISIKRMIDGMYEEYGKILTSAGQAFKMANGQKYRLHITGVQAGDKQFQADFEKYIEKQLKDYLKSENAVYPEFDGYELKREEKTTGANTSEDFLKLKKDMFRDISSAMHIPISMTEGNITNMKEVIASFLTFGVDPYADMIAEALNKRAGMGNFLNGNYYQVDTGKINHRDVFEIAVGVSNLVSSGIFCIDEVREELGMAALNTEWSRKHFITKNFEEIERYLGSVKGGEKSEEEVLSDYIQWKNGRH